MSISNRSILVFLTVTLALTACKKTDSSDIQDEVPIYQDYYVRYDKTENVTVAKATFKTNGDNSKFASNFSNNDNFKRKAPGRNNHNAPKLIEKYNNLAREALSNGDKIRVEGEEGFRSIKKLPTEATSKDGRAGEQLTDDVFRQA